MEDKKSRYNGHVANCMRHGDGTYDYPGASYKYEGNWVQGVKQAKKGRFSLPGCFVYEGEFVDGEITGKGTKTWTNGRVYTGDWLNGEMHGFGRWSNSTGSEVYEGHFDNNKRQGDGMLTVRGDVYKGGFESHIFGGHGVYLREGKYVLDINFIKGIGQGFGSIKWHKKAYFEGNWMNGVPCDHGYFTLADGSFGYTGAIHRACPAVLSTCLHLDVDPTRDRKKMPPSAIVVPGAPAAAPAKKGKDKSAPEDPNSIPLPVFEPGEWMGDLLLHTYVDKEKMQHDGDESGGIHVTAPNELCRRLLLSVCPLLPPAPPTEGAPADAASPSPNPLVGPPIPLWRRKPTLNAVSESWSRFPSSVPRVVDGKGVLNAPKSENNVHVTVTLPMPAPSLDEDGIEVPLPPPTVVEDVKAHGLLVDEVGVLCHRVTAAPLDAISMAAAESLPAGFPAVGAISYRITPQLHFMDGSFTAEMAFLLDFRLDTWTLLSLWRQHRPAPAPLPPRPLTGASTANGASRRELISRANSEASLRSRASQSRSFDGGDNNGNVGEIMPDIIPEEPKDVEITVMKVEKVQRPAAPPAPAEDDATSKSPPPAATACSMRLVMIIPHDSDAVDALEEHVKALTESKKAALRTEIQATLEATERAIAEIEEARAAAEGEDAPSSTPAAPAAKGKAAKEAEAAAAAAAEAKRAAEKAKIDEIVQEAVAQAIAELPHLDAVAVRSFSAKVRWELRLYPENSEEEAASSASPKAVSPRPEQPLGGEADAVTEAAEEDEEPEYTVLYQWTDGSFNPVMWHSLSLTLRNRSPPNTTQDALAMSAIATAELFIDGHGKVLSSDAGSSDVGAAFVSDWINMDLRSTTETVTLQPNSSTHSIDKAHGDGKHGKDKDKSGTSPRRGETASPRPPDQPTTRTVHAQVRVSVGGDTSNNFGGFVKLFAAFNKWNRCSAEELTSCFDTFHSRSQDSAPDGNDNLYYSSIVKQNPADVAALKEVVAECTAELEKAAERPASGGAEEGKEAEEAAAAAAASSTAPAAKGKSKADAAAPAPEATKSNKPALPTPEEIAKIAPIAAPLTSLPAAPFSAEEDCDEVLEAPVLCRGGRGELHDLVIAKGSSTGVYVVVVKDGIDPSAVWVQPTPEEEAIGKVPEIDPEVAARATAAALAAADAGDELPPEAMLPEPEPVEFPTQLLPGRPYLACALVDPTAQGPDSARSQGSARDGIVNGGDGIVVDGHLDGAAAFGCVAAGTLEEHLYNRLPKPIVLKALPSSLDNMYQSVTELPADYSNRIIINAPPEAP